MPQRSRRSRRIPTSQTSLLGPRLGATATAPEMPIDEMWLEFRRTNSEELRNRLMEHYLPLVRYTAERLHSKLPDEVDIDDMISAGVFGLMDAIDSFDLERKVKFETYSAPRVRGAILDDLRSLDWVPRLVRSRTSQVEYARKKLQMRLGREPSVEEVTEQLQLSPEEFQKIVKDSGAVSLVSLSRKCFETDSNRDVREVDVLGDPRQVDPLTVVHKRDLKELITRGLSRAERMVVILYYYEQMTMKEIGMVLDLSESRVSQMHSSILARLKAQLQSRQAEISADLD